MISRPQAKAHDIYERASDLSGLGTAEQNRRLATRIRELAGIHHDEKMPFQQLIDTSRAVVKNIERWQRYHSIGTFEEASSDFLASCDRGDGLAMIVLEAAVKSPSIVAEDTKHETESELRKADGPLRQLDRHASQPQ